MVAGSFWTSQHANDWNGYCVAGLTFSERHKPPELGIMILFRSVTALSRPDPSVLWLVVQVIYGTVVLALSIYSLNHGILAVVFWRLRRRHPDEPPATPLGRDVRVTIQLPLFNEIHVAERLIRSACAVDYPRDLLEIQVLDDSTDETVGLTRRLVGEYQAAGVPIVHLHRTDRTGYKSGALANALAQASGEFIAIFDADFVIPADFLRRTLPHFGDPAIGIVQTRWSYFNETSSELTRAASLALDGHFVVEQSARCWAGWFLNFNGTAGVLRRQAIVEAGGWQDDTLTEDLDLSYRAQLRGWKAVFLPHVACPSEIPDDIHSLKVQQFRWTKGPIETARKNLRQLWQSDHGLLVKWQGSIHLLSALGYPLLVVLTLLSPLMVLAAGRHALPMIWPITAYFLTASFGTWFCYASAAYWLGGKWWQRMARYPLFLAMSIGLSAHNAVAAVEGIWGIRSPFMRTPKYRSGAVRRYRSPVSWSMAGDMALSLASGSALALAIHEHQYGALPCLSLFAVGYGAVSVFSVLHLAPRHRRVVHATRADAELASAPVV
jgi:cellulose synthase/poly-beta-1,6-N-acetylglucosamine synthase-like glycosyltransferase